MKKLCIVFPGRAYTCDRSLLYFPSKVIEKYGFEICRLKISKPIEDADKLPFEELASKMKADFSSSLQEIKWDEYDQFVFLSKSVGTIIASQVKAEHHDKKIDQILVTPLEDTLPYITTKDLIFCGDKDRYFPDAKAKLSNYPNGYIFPGFPHSLEDYDNYRLTIKTLLDITTITDVYMANLTANKLI